MERSSFPASVATSHCWKLWLKCFSLLCTLTCCVNNYVCHQVIGINMRNESAKTIINNYRFLLVVFLWFFRTKSTTFCFPELENFKKTNSVFNSVPQFSLQHGNLGEQKGSWQQMLEIIKKEQPLTKLSCSQKTGSTSLKCQKRLRVG